MNEFVIIEIEDEDLDVTERWLARVKVIEEEEEDEEGEVFVNRRLVFELIQKLVGEGDNSLELCFEICKLPVKEIRYGYYSS